MSSSEAIRKIFIAQAKGDLDALREASQAYIASERQKSHHTLASDLEKILNSSNGSTRSVRELFTLNRPSAEIPKDKERGLILAELREPQRSIDELVLWNTTRHLLNRIIEENRRSDLIRSVGLWPARKLLFWGPPGCGKTVAAEALARELYLPLCVVRFDAVISSYLGETSANLRKVFDYARQRPMVLLFDEFDAIGKMREDPDEHGELKRVVNAFLQMMDSFQSDAIMIAATNHEGLLDRALWRRFDEVVNFGLPNSAQVRELMVRNLRQMKVATNVRLATLTTKLCGMSHADIERIVVNSIKATVMREEEAVSAGTLDEEISKQKHRSASVIKPDSRPKRTLRRRQTKKRNASQSKR